MERHQQAEAPLNMLNTELAELKSQLPDKGFCIQNTKTVTGKINQLVSDVAQVFVQYEQRNVITVLATPKLEQHGIIDY